MTQRFVVSYLLWLGILFGLFYWDLSPISHSINEFLRVNLIKILDAGLEPGRVHGFDIWINPHYKLMIEKACNGMIPVLMYLASIFAYPSSWTRRIYWAIAGTSIILVLNIVRIFIVVHFVIQGGRENFSLSHDIFGNALFMVAGLAMFYLFIRGSRIRV
jgi:exosortase/archaeosortase family protein